MISKFLFLLSESFRGLHRAKMPTLISSVTIAMSLIILSSAMLFYYNFIGLSQDMKSDFTIKVFFEEGISTEDAWNTNISITSEIDGITEFKFIDKEDASIIFKKYFNEDVNEILGENPLPISAEYTMSEKFRNLDKATLIQRAIEEYEGIEEVQFATEAIQKINKIIEIILSISLFVGIFILWISIILVSNTITLIIYAKQRTIEILKLLGATSSFIRFPFILEGVFQGLLGSLISIIMLYFLNSLQVYFLDSIAGNHMLVPEMIIPCNIVLGVLLGVVGSYRALFNKL